jgi:MFS family permease
MEHEEKRKQRKTTAVFFFLSGIMTATWSSRIPDVQQKLGLNDAAWGTVLVAVPAGQVTGLFFSSWLVTKFGSRRTVTGACIIASILLFLLGIANRRGALMVALFFTGFIRTVINISANTRAVEVQALYERPIISTFHGVWSVACLIAAGIGTMMIVLRVGPPLHFTIIALACLFIAILLLERRTVLPNSAAPRRPFLFTPGRYLMLLGAMAFCGMMGENTMFDWSVNYFDRVLHASKGMMTLGYTCFIITMATGRLIGDRLIHAYGHLTMLKFNAALMAAGFFLSATFPYPVIVATGFLLIGFGDSIIVPTLYALASRSVRMQPAYAIASVTFMGYLGFLSAPLIVGTVSQIKNMQWAFALIGLFVLVIVMLVRPVKSALEKQQPLQNPD